MSSDTKTWKIAKENENKRLDVFLTEKLPTSRNQVQNKIESGRVKINDNRATKNGIFLSEGDEIKLFPKNKKSKQEIKTELNNFDIKLVKKADNYLVVSKPSGLLVHPTAAQEKVTLANWLVYNFPEIKTVGEFDDRPGIVHRLDRDTSGLLVVARSNEMFDHLKRQFKKRKIYKEYRTLVHGRINSKHDTIKLPIGRNKKGKFVAKPKNSKKGKSAITKFEVIDRLGGYTYLKVNIITGRTHQIRVHMNAYGFPIVGDKLNLDEGDKTRLDEDLDRIFLHAQKLCFYDLEKNKICKILRLPKELKQVIQNLG